tara:strand:- start:113 stop:442 length:330 start_codon:yes stop_codon:yes gene_type:complete
MPQYRAPKRAKWIWVLYSFILSLWLFSIVFVGNYLEGNLPNYWIAVLLWVIYLAGSVYAFLKFTNWFDLKYQRLYVDEEIEGPIDPNTEEIIKDVFDGFFTKKNNKKKD